MKTITDILKFKIEWSDEDNCYVAKCIEHPSISAHGNTPEEALEQIKFVILELHK